MRIIAGEFRGRRLISPGTDEVRPTSDKVKEAVFSMLMPYMEAGGEGGPVCMDVFAGSGSLGLEAVSRGAKKVYFADSSRESLALARQNAKLCGAEDRAVFFCGDFRNTIKRVGEDVHIFFLDPPYAQKTIPEALRIIDECGICPGGGVAVCEHGKKEVLGEKLHGFTLIKERRYGATGISIYERD